MHGDLLRASDGRRPSGGGFTLVELVAVLVVTAVLAAVAVPAVSSLASTRSASAARAVLHHLAYARQHAMATGTGTWAVFDAGAEACSLLEEDPSNPGRAGAGAMSDPTTGSAMTLTLGAGEFVGTGITSAVFDAGDEVGFDWMGRAFNAAESALAARGTVTLSGGRAVYVEPETGAVWWTP